MDRAKTPWLVFAGHRPMYVNSGGAGAGDCKGAAAEEEHCSNMQPVAKLLRESFELLFIEHQVCDSMSTVCSAGAQTNQHAMC